MGGYGDLQTTALRNRLDRAGSEALRWFWQGCLKPNRPLLLVVAIATAGAILVRTAGYPVFAFLTFREFYVGMLLAGLLVLPARLLVFRLQVRDDQGNWQTNSRLGWRLAWRRMVLELFHPAAALRAGIALVLLAYSLCLFVGWKRLIPEVVPFYLDPTLERWDIWLHGGRPPWDWLRPLNIPYLSLFIERIYYSALGIFVLSLAWAAWSQHPVRNRLLVGAVVVWFGLGSVAATLLSSAGPAFVAASFADQRAYLMSVPGLLSPTAWQDMWRIYLERGYSPIASISAMPSLHVATPVLLVCAAATRYGWMLVPGVISVLLTFMSAVYLGWHYALDGYVSVIAVLLYWWLSDPKRSPLPGIRA